MIQVTSLLLIWLHPLRLTIKVRRSVRIASVMQRPRFSNPASLTRR
jgi:hypothetical protein